MLMHWQMNAESIFDNEMGRLAILNHYELKHLHLGHACRYLCTFSECPCIFKTWNVLHSSSLFSGFPFILLCSVRLIMLKPMVLIMYWNLLKYLKSPEDHGVMFLYWVHLWKILCIVFNKFDNLGAHGITVFIEFFWRFLFFILHNQMLWY